MTAQSAAPRRTIMTTFTIDEQNNISAFSNQEEAAATATPFDSFSSQKELAELAKAWPAERLVAIFNSLTGVTPVESFKSSKAAASRIWGRIKGLGAPEEPKPEQATKPKAKKNAKGGAQSAKGAPAKATASKKATPAKKAPKAKKVAKKSKPAKEPKAAGTGSKSEEVIGRVLFRRYGCEPALRVVFALAGVWRRRDDDVGAGDIEQTVHYVAVAAITADDFVPGNCPNVAGARNRLSRSFGNLLFGILAGLGDVGGLGKQHGQLVIAEAQCSQVNVSVPEFCQLFAEQVVVERRQFGQLVIRDEIGALLGFCQMVQDDDGHRL